MRDDDFADEMNDVISMIREFMTGLNRSITNTDFKNATWKDVIINELFKIRDKTLRNIRKKCYYVLKYNGGYITSIGHKLPDVKTTKYLEDRIINFSTLSDIEYFLVRYSWLSDYVEIKKIASTSFGWEEV